MRHAGIAALLIAFAPAAGADTLLVGNKGEDTLSRVDLSTGTEAQRVATGRMPHEIAISPNGHEAAVVAYGGRTIELIDVASGRKVRTIDLGAGARPHGLLWLSDGRMLATAEGVDALMIVARDGAVTRVPTGQKGSHMVVVTPDARRAYVANMKSASVTEIDLPGARKLRDIPVGSEPEGIAVTPDGRTLWVADRGGNAVHILALPSGRETAKLPTGTTPIRVAMTPDGRQAVVSNFGDGSLSVFDVATRKLLRTIPVGGATAAQVTILFSRDGRRLYAAETGTDRIAEVDFARGRVLRRLPAGKQGDGLAISPVALRKE